MSCCSACGKHACACGCGAGTRTPRSLYNRPGLDSLVYRVGTYADFRATMQLDLSDAALPALAGLRTRELDDPSMALLDAWAIGADVLSFYQERIVNEGYLRTATERCSVLQLGRLVDYRLRPGVAASVYLAYTVDDNSPTVTIPIGAKAQSVPAPGEQMQTFETAEPLEARSAWNGLKPRLSRPQDITVQTIAGLGELWIAGTGSNLKQGDRLLFLFGDLATGVQAVRIVQSVEPQATGGRSRIVLRPMDPIAVALVQAANVAIDALNASSAGPNHDEWLSAVTWVRKLLLFGGDQTDSYDTLMKPPFGNDDPSPGPPAADAFAKAAQAAFGNGSDGDGGFPPPFSVLFDALTLSPTVQPANSLLLARNAAVALGIASDARPQLLLNFEARLRDTFYGAWTSVPNGVPSPQLGGVFALRLAAPMFGYNAVIPMGLAVNTDSSTKGAIPYVSVPGNDWAPSEAADVVQLDNAYDGIAADSYLMVAPQRQDQLPFVAQARSVKIHPRTAYGISGKTTQVALVNPGSEPLWDVSGDTDIGRLRSTQVFAQSDALTLADQTITDDVGDVVAPAVPTDGPTRLTLDAPVDGLKPGRWVIVEGERADVPADNPVISAELVMLAAVEQGADANLSGDTVHSTLVFANKGLAYSYRRDTVKVYANVVRATNGETRNEVLGYGNGATPLQRFSLKQSPLTYVSAATVDGVQSTLAVMVNGVQWHEVRNLAFVDGNQRSFVAATDDSGKTSVTFGDGTHGARLPTGVENVAAVYRNGIGTPGNVKAGQISLLTTKPLGVKNVINPLRASGGADAETRDQARANVPLAVLALDRLVSITDYADFARTFGGVGKAAAVKLGNQVRVTIAGAADAPVDATSDLYRNLLQALQRYGDPALPVSLDVRELLALTLSAKVGLVPDVTWEAVEPQVRAALLGRFGFERRGLAQNVYLSEIVACIQSVRGVAWVDADAFGHLDETTILAGFGMGGEENGDKGDGSVSLAGVARINTVNHACGQAAVNQRVQALPARYDDDGLPLPAQIACFVPTVPDTLLLQEARS
jgi:predicted phage baseplate assembly protein